MERVDWIWEVLRVMENDAQTNGWVKLIDQINVTRSILSAEVAAALEPTTAANVIRVHFGRRDVVAGSVRS